ncbi:replication protein (plasmid) [Pseudoalteromonas sp. PS1M3]|uniref:replication/maintenance protein RepL n=1 Tax=Pseudoalteromonas sp. PS1M3 TaxID=87791 RepID=UPI00159EC8FE|nr:replication/maintenance protein RepL [Pseudoalteromonas sp. PS1M3]BBW93863.1 replication protein [Pseudoalteromonas sp. PS1M3]
MSLQRYKENPFLKDMEINTSNKQVTVSALGKDNNVLVNQSTGEISGTSVVTYKKVDDAEFVKLFSANIALTFDLKSAGIKTFSVLIWMVQHRAIGKDQVILDHMALEEWCEVHEPKSISHATFKRGLNELEKAKIIAKTMRKGTYFINPNFVFNGNRIAFTTVIERGNKAKNENQQELPLGD